ncbi:MAG TPA: matrixin family metalloprotease [Candidatus Hypogeohydataceae bacterium YC40]
MLVTPGAASFSAMPAGVYLADDGASTTDFFALVAGDELAIVHNAMAAWVAATGGNLRDLGTVSDNGAPFNSFPADPQGLEGPFGDIRLAAVHIPTRSVIAHAYFPPSNGISASGDIHFDNRVGNNFKWTDDPNKRGLDFYKVALHELGHSLGLDHSKVVGSVMYPFYWKAGRTLTADDIAGIQAIYGMGGLAGTTPSGPSGGNLPVPEPATLLLVGSGLLGLSLRRRWTHQRRSGCGNSG